MNNIYYCYVESDTLPATDIFNGMTQAEARLLVEEELNGVRREGFNWQPTPDSPRNPGLVFVSVRVI